MTSIESPAAGLDAAGIRELMRRNIEDVFAVGAVDLLDEIYSHDFVDHNPAPRQRGGLDGLRDLLAAFHVAFPDQQMELHGTLADGDFGVDFWTFRGTHLGVLDGVEPTGRTVEFAGIDVARIANGRISEIWHVEDMASAWSQITAR